MPNTSPPQPMSVFRTDAWTQAWLDTWGADTSKGLIDIGGRGRPLEMLYRIPHRFKRVVPASVLCLVGNGFGHLSTPRAEYNDLNDLICAAGGISMFGKELQKLSWEQFCLTDIAATSAADDDARSLLSSQPWGCYMIREERSYSIRNYEFDQYLAQLSKSTRLAFFNRRTRLLQLGTVERCQIPLSKVDNFFALLNGFHLHRWGQPCYSNQSMSFLRNFCERLKHDGGEAVFDALSVNGQPVSVLFDVIWGDFRYNLQSGYLEQFAPKVSLGSLHLGFAIEDALKAGQNYDFLAGKGKNTNYKASIATHTTSLRSYIATRGYWKLLKNLQAGLQSNGSESSRLNS